MVLDAPILASDEEYRPFFKTDVLEDLTGAGVQTIVFSLDQKTWRDLEHRYLHMNIDIFQMALPTGQTAQRSPIQAMTS